MNEDTKPTIFEWLGGQPGLDRLTRIFYERYVPADPLLGPLFTEMAPDHPTRVAKWLGEVFGGPTAYSSEHGGYPRMLARHLGRGITEEARARWVELMMRSAREAGLPDDPEFGAAFAAYLEWGSRLARANSQPGAQPPADMPMPRWDWTTAAGPPGIRRSAASPQLDDKEETVDLPAADQPVSFATHIKPLFRSTDRQSMNFAFDLWDLGDVRSHSDAILRRLLQGAMPCDGRWSPDKIEIFRRWIDTGKSE